VYDPVKHLSAILEEASCKNSDKKKEIKILDNPKSLDFIVSFSISTHYLACFDQMFDSEFAWQRIARQFEPFSIHQNRNQQQSLK
jgi:hypothetical protein